MDRELSLLQTACHMLIDLGGDVEYAAQCAAATAAAAGAAACAHQPHHEPWRRPRVRSNRTDQ